MASQKIYPCPQHGCDYTTQRQADVDRHFDDVHLRKKSYTCPFDGCGAQKSQMEHLKTHWRSQHAGPDGMVFACVGPNCTFKCADPTQAKRHVAPSNKPGCPNITPEQRFLHQQEPNNRAYRLFSGSPIDYPNYPQLGPLPAPDYNRLASIPVQVATRLPPVGTGRRRNPRPARGIQPAANIDNLLPQAPAPAFEEQAVSQRAISYFGAPAAPFNPTNSSFDFGNTPPTPEDNVFPGDFDFSQRAPAAEHNVQPYDLPYYGPNGAPVEQGSYGSQFVEQWAPTLDTPTNNNSLDSLADEWLSGLDNNMALGALGLQAPTLEAQIGQQEWNNSINPRIPEILQVNNNAASAMPRQLAPTPGAFGNFTTTPNIAPAPATAVEEFTWGDVFGSEGS